MLWLTLGLALVISLLAVAFALWPLMSPQVKPYYVEDDRLTELLSRKDTVLAAIKDLEFDYHMGKMSSEDYERFNARLRRQAIGYLQQIERLSPQTASLDEQLEREIAQMRRIRAGQSGHRQTECAGCGATLATGQRFCGNCGVAVTPSTSPKGEHV